MNSSTAGVIFLLVLVAGFVAWGVAVLVIEEIQDRRFWREIKGRAARPNEWR